jgi:uncharacterized protein (DUF2336 family)
MMTPAHIGRVQAMAKFPSLIDELETALATGDGAQREEMLSRITDLFLSGADRYSTDQVVVFDEVIGKLATTIESKARAKLAAKLAPISNAPAGVIHQLAFDDDIQVAQPVLGLSAQLADADLVANANTKSQKHLVAISERKALSEEVTDVLVSRGDKQVVHTVSKNAGARFSYAGYRLLVKRSAGDDELSLLLGARKDIPRQQFLRLLDEASSAVRARLMAENPQAGSAVAGVVREVGGEIRKDARRNYAAARKEVESLRRLGRLNEEAVQRFARERQFEHAAVALSLLCEVEHDMAERALLAPGNDILLILTKLAGFSWMTAKALLMLKAGSSGISQQDLDRALASFGRLQVGTARRVLSFHQARSDRSPGDASARAS